MTKREELIVGLDVGTTNVIVVVGQIQEGMVQMIGLGKAPNSGLRKGTVVDIEETVSAISSALEQAEKSCGVPLTGCYASIGGNQIVSTDSKGVIAVSRADGEIQSTDTERVLDAAKSVALPPNYEIIHVVAKDYSVDGQAQIKDPLGMSGIRLEVNAQVVGIATPALRNLSRSITQSGLDIEGIVFAPLASAKAYLSKKQKELGTILIDIGASNTSVAVFEEGTVIHTKVIPIGANHITNDINIGLKITPDLAEKIKINEVDVDLSGIRESEKVDLSKYDSNEKEKPNRQYICEIAEARLNEILSLIKEELVGIDRDGMLPGGAVIVGGGAKLKGLHVLAKKILSLPVQIGKLIFEVSGIVDKLDDPEYATAVGLMMWGLDEGQNFMSNSKRPRVSFDKFSGAIDRAKNIFKNFIP